MFGDYCSGSNFASLFIISLNKGVEVYMRHNHLLLVVFFSLFVCPVVAQLGVITGKISDNGPSGTLAGVNVYLEGTRLGDATNGKGEFKIERIPAGTYTLVASNMGYVVEKRQVEIGPDQIVEMLLKLQENLQELPGVTVERIMMVGGAKGLMEIPGAAHYIGPKELDKFSYTDINRVLRAIPGMNIQEEDGFGLRPNIGMRGTGVERTSKIAIMEDGILMAPAPYTAPAAYFFPRMGRMQGVEVRKGSSQIKYGPFTTGGAINLISTQIPSEFGGRVQLMGGSFGTRTTHAFIGDSFEQVGYVVETFQAVSDGFKELDNGGPTGFNSQDYVAKIRVNTKADAKIYQALTLKLGQSNEISDETYLGLTESDFRVNPFRRYAASQMDKMTTRQNQVVLRHVVRPAKFLDITTSVYRTEFSRNWYKVDQVGGAGITAILDNPDNFASQFAIVTGGNSADNALRVRANNRSYYSRGLQSVFGFNFASGSVSHDIEAGIRIHRDGMDRFQWDDRYRMTEGTMFLTAKGIPGTQDNRVETADAYSTFLQYSLKWNKWTLIPGFRYENVHMQSVNYGGANVNRDPSLETITRAENKVGIWIPGVSVDYRVSPSLNTFFGVHKGFSPPGSRVGTLPEESINYELGSRWASDRIYSQAVIFLNNYANLLGVDLAAAGGGGTTDQFNGGAALTYGLELEFYYNLFTDYANTWSVPLGLVYTYTQGTFENTFETSFPDWGPVVNKGDKIPYLAEHQVALSLSFEHKKFNINLNGRFISEMRTVAGTGGIEVGTGVDAVRVLDVSTNYHVSKKISLFGSVNNVTNEVYSVARRPAGLRPGMPRSLMLGLKANF
jgi:Fe(3+) dicitrate transport protein